MSGCDTLQRTTAAHPRRFERKFYLPPSRIPFAAHLLTHCCPKDEHFPKGTIHSVYYDTSDYECLRDSEEGNHDRNKVRIRWYDDPQETEPQTAVYLELKTKDGFAGIKQRRRFLIPTHRLTRPELHAAILDPTTIRGTLFQFGHFPERFLHPAIFISYHRLRFRDITTGVRISLDWRIRSTPVSPHLNRHEGSLLMQGGVIEIKGPSTDIPRALQSIRLLGTDWSRYSKFAACLEAQLDDPGAVGRFWPSGRVKEI